MHTYSFYPSWRPTKEKVTVVREPTAAWFAELREPCVARFAVLDDGGLYFGDALMVLHRDMTLMKGEADEGVLVVGALGHRGERWRTLICQYFASGIVGEKARQRAARLLGQMTGWHDLVRVLGNDPMGEPLLGEDL